MSASADAPSPSRKRARTAEDPFPDEIKPSTPYWDDGNIILLSAAPRSSFRVHRSLLAAASTVFKDMFMVGAPTEGEQMDGCPVVQLSDAAVELSHFLDAIYDRHSFRESPTILCIGDVLTLSNKYDVERLHEEAIQALREFAGEFTFDTACIPYEEVGQSDGEFIILANLASRFEQPKVTARALWILSMLDSKEFLFKGELLYGIDDPRAGTIQRLSPDNAHLCLQASVLAKDRFTASLAPTFNYPSSACEDTKACRAMFVHVGRQARDHLQIEHLNILNDMSSRILYDVYPPLDDNPCERCINRKTAEYNTERHRTFVQLSRLFRAT